MRFREIYAICNKNYDNMQKYCGAWSREYRGLKENGAKMEIPDFEARHSNLRYLRKGMKESFESIKCFDSTFAEINEAMLKKDLDEELYLYQCLLIKVKGIIELYESLEQPKEDIGLDIKIPETDSITEFKKYVDDLEFIFTKCPFFQSDEERLRFKTVDVGSIWLVIGVSGAVAGASVLLNNIAAFIDKCFIIKSHKTTYEMQKLEIQKAEIEQKEKEEIVESIKRIYKIAVKNAIKELEKTTGHQISDGDEEGRVEQSFEKLEKLMDKGLQIYSSIDSPAEVKALFKPLEMHYLPIEKELKKIGKKLSEDSDSE